MDEMDISTIDEIDQEVFDVSPGDSDDEEGLPLPDCIGIDSALQDDEKLRLESLDKCQTNNKSRKERELELRMLAPDSIRRQILERSITNQNERSNSSDQPPSGSSRSHVMNIIEKAGMSGIDKEKINQVIHEASKGSLFYQKQAQRQAEIHRSIENMLNRVQSATPQQIEAAKVSCEKMFEAIKERQAFNKIIVHFDLDMFFAAVEIRDNPALKDKPVAVGGDSMISTSNYVARRFGVRAAMPGFIARKLCPDLILIRPNGAKYRQASSEVFDILEHYDPELTNMSLDEAYLDLTESVRCSLERDGSETQEYYDGTLPKIWWSRANEIVEEIRQAIFDKTKLTCSAGISCNTLLSKISTDINKPDGQFMVRGYPRDVLDFISKTQVEKVSGIGKVSAQFLNALDIKTCGDIFAKRHFLPLVFYEINVRFYLRVALGDGSTSIRSDEQRKSKSVERTFAATKDETILLDKLDNICDELCNKYLKPYRIRGRTITVKLKRNTFTTTTKSFSLLAPTNDKLVVYSTAKNLLLSEIANEPQEITYRLLGVKLSNLADDSVATNQLTIDAMLKNHGRLRATKSNETVHRVTGEPLEEVSQDDRGNRSREMALDDSTSSNVSNPTSKSSMIGSNKRPSPSGPTIQSFFLKRPRGSDAPNTSNQNSIINQDKNEELSGVDCETIEDPILTIHGSVTPDSPSQCTSNADENFHCPYCFKSLLDFSSLELHVSTCRFKTSIDVNKSFYSQRASPSTNPQTNTSSKRKQPEKTTRTRRQSETPRVTNGQASQATKNTDRRGSSGCSTAKPSYYQQFLESNSQSLSQAKRSEPLRCPHCCHGFLSFPSLETHVMTCSKQRT